MSRQLNAALVTPEHDKGVSWVFERYGSSVVGPRWRLEHKAFFAFSIIQEKTLFQVKMTTIADLFTKYNCTNCQDDIQGIRVHCAECENFDLCLPVSISTRMYMCMYECVAYSYIHRLFTHTPTQHNAKRADIHMCLC